MTTEIETMKTMGKEWKSDDGSQHRIYFNDLCGLYGLDVDRYGTGNISSAKLDGKKLSNGKARSLCTTLDFAKVFYDVPAGEFGSKGLENDKFTKIVVAIKARLEGTA